MVNAIPSVFISAGSFWLMTKAGEGTASSAPTVLFAIGAFFAVCAVLSVIVDLRRSKYTR